MCPACGRDLRMPVAGRGADPDRLGTSSTASATLSGEGLLSAASWSPLAVVRPEGLRGRTQG